MLKAVAYQVDPVLWAIESFGFEPDKWQSKALRSSSKRSIWNIHRQGGKSSVAALRVLHKALYYSGSLTLIVAPIKDQSKELFRKIVGYYDELPEQPGMKEDTSRSFILTTGSRVIALSGDEDNVRSFSAPDMIIEDEAARCSDALFYAIRPMLATSNGNLLLLSTPKGQCGHFHEIWNDGDPLWERVQVRASECPRISASFLEEERKSNLLFDQEYNCQFMADDNQIFSDEIIKSISDDSIEPLFEVDGNHR